MVNNQGIMHLAATKGGLPVCRNQRAHMSTTEENFRQEPKQCKRCAAHLAKRDARAEKKQAQELLECLAKPYPFKDGFIVQQNDFSHQFMGAYEIRNGARVGRLLTVREFARVLEQQPLAKISVTRC